MIRSDSHFEVESSRHLLLGFGLRSSLCGDNDSKMMKLNCALDVKHLKEASLCGLLVQVVSDEQPLDLPFDERATNKNHALELKNQ